MMMRYWILGIFVLSATLPASSATPVFVPRESSRTFQEPRRYPFERPFPYFSNRSSLRDRPLGSRMYFTRPRARDFNGYPLMRPGSERRFEAPRGYGYAHPWSFRWGPQRWDRW